MLIERLCRAMQKRRMWLSRSYAPASVPGGGSESRGQPPSHRQSANSGIVLDSFAGNVMYAERGPMTAVWTIVLAGALSALAAWFGSEYDVFANVQLPQWFDRDALTSTALASGLAAVATMLVAGVLGGLWGTRYHRLADQTILDAQELHEVEV